MVKTITLSQLDIAEKGLNICWTSNSDVVAHFKEITLIYYKTDVDASINSQSVDVDNVNLSLDLDAGSSYYLQLQIIDGAGSTLLSNVLQCTTPYALSAPVITEITGFDNAIDVSLQSASGLSESDTIEFVIRKADNTLFWMVKPFSSSNLYRLSSSDDGRLANNTSYKVACMFQPSPTSPLYKAPSSISNTMSAMPSNIPNAATNLTLVDAFSSSQPTKANLRLDWSRPSDYDDWVSRTYSVVLGLKESVGVWVYTTLSRAQDASTMHYDFLDVDRMGSFQASVQYINTYGSGPVTVFQSFVTPTCVPDAPILFGEQSQDQAIMAQNIPPAFTGNKSLLRHVWYRLNDDQTSSLVANIQPLNSAYVWSGLTNGVAYSFYLVSVNDNGESPRSAVLTVTPKGASSISSVSVAGNSLTSQVIPNGRRITKVIFLAVPVNPSPTDVFIITRDITDPTITGTIALSANFGFTVSKYAVIITSEANSAYSMNM